MKAEEEKLVIDQGWASLELSPRQLALIPQLSIERSPDMSSVSGMTAFK